MTRLTKSILNRQATLPTPSFEEEVFAAEQSAQYMRDSGELEEEVGVLINRVDKVEEYLEKKDSLFIQPEEMTEEEKKEILAFTELLNEGTGIVYGSVMPSNESRSEVSLESLRDYLKVTFEALGRLIERLAITIGEYWRLFTTQIGSVVRRAKAIREEVRNKVGRTVKVEKLKLEKGIYFNGFYRAGIYPGNADKIEEWFQELIDYTTFIFTDWNRKMITAGVDVFYELENVNLQDIDSTLISLNNKTKDIWAELADKYYDGIDLIGRVRLEATKPVLVEGESNTEVARKVQQYSFKVIEREMDTGQTVIVFKTPSLLDIDKLMTMIIRTGENLNEKIRYNHLPRLTETSRRFVRSASRRVGLGNDTSDQGRYQSRIDFTYRYASKYMSWVKSPAMEMATTLVKVSRAIQALSALTIEQYE